MAFGPPAVRHTQSGFLVGDLEDQVDQQTVKTENRDG